MRIKPLLTVFIVTLITMTCCMRTSFPLSLMDEFDKKESREWTTKDLEDKLPNYIKEIMARNKLIPWEQSDVMYFCKKIFYAENGPYLSISVTYVNKDEFFRSNIITGHRKELDFLTIYPNLWKNNLHIEKMAEAIFSASTGELVEFKIKVKGSQWITIYDLEMQTEI